MTSRYDESQYLDALVTLELAAKFAQRDKRPVNSVIRTCWCTVRPRVTNELNRRIFDGMVKQFMPHGALCMLRRQLDDAISD